MRIYLGLIAGGLVAGAVTMHSCGESDDKMTVDLTGREQVMSSVVDRVFVPTFEELVTTTGALKTAAETYAQAAATSSAAAERAAVHTAFKSAMVSVQKAELLRMGPYGPSGKFAGGQSIRDEVYSWSVVSECSVDQQIVAQDYQMPDFASKKLVAFYGMDALEYLLFFDGSKNDCAAPVKINADGTWAALSSADLRSRRAAYAAVVAAEIAAQAVIVRDAWKNDFATKAAQAGMNTEVYSSAQMALDELFASMFYLEKQVKDTKLALPLAILPGCAKSSCADLVESKYAQHSMENIRANIATFQLIYHGGDKSDAAAYGFDDLLKDNDQAALADELTAAVEAAVKAGEAAPIPMAENLEAAETKAVHTALKQVAMLLKTQFVSVLALRVPSEGAADND